MVDIWNGKNKDVGDFEAVKEIFMKIVENVDTIDENIGEEFRMSENELKTTAIDLANFEENYYTESESDSGDILIAESYSCQLSQHFLVLIITYCLVSAL